MSYEDAEPGELLTACRIALRYLDWCLRDGPTPVGQQKDYREILEYLKTYGHDGRKPMSEFIRAHLRSTIENASNAIEPAKEAPAQAGVPERAKHPGR